MRLGQTGTVADIVKEMRCLRGFPVPYASSRAVWLGDFHAYADRIEAAHKQEAIDRFGEGVLAGMREAEKDAQGRPKNGNAAAMREALDVIAKTLEDCELVVLVLPSLAKAAREALAAPPRNADRFATAQEAQKAWFEWSGDGRNCNADGTVKLTFAEWLMAEAESEAAQ